MVSKITKIHVDAGPAIELPVLFSVEGRPLVPLLRYQLTRRTRSLSWHRKVVSYVKLFLDYAEANSEFYSTPKELFDNFLARIEAGTIDGGADPSGLYWFARKPSLAAEICLYITNFSAFMSAEYNSADLNPLRKANWAERLCISAGKMYRNRNSFLSHLKSSKSDWSRTKYVRGGLVRAARSVRVDGGKSVSFPVDRLGDLIIKGFCVRPNVADRWLRLNVRDVLITLMLCGGGLRCSEPFHMYINDVVPDPLDESTALIRIGHPSAGNITYRDVSGEVVTTTRGAYLLKNGLPRRDRIAGPMHAGWKNAVLDGKYYLQVRWGEPEYGRLFLRLWGVYLAHYLDLKIKPKHPWAWVNFAKGREGEPLKMGRYIAAHNRAICRIGMVPLKERGTTPHAHRHTYAKWLHDLGLPRELIRRYLHHSSLASQEVYKQMDEGEMNLAMQSGLARMGGGDAGAVVEASDSPREVGQKKRDRIRSVARPLSDDLNQFLGL